MVSENLSSGLTPSILTASNSTILGEDSEMSVTGQLLGDTDSRPVDTTKGSFLGRFVSDAIGEERAYNERGTLTTGSVYII